MSDPRGSLRPSVVQDDHLTFLDQWWATTKEYKGRSTARRALEAEFASLTTAEAKAVVEYWQMTNGASWR